MMYTCGPENNTKNIHIELPSEPKNIYIGVSGGADSAILLYILTKLNKEKNNLHNIVPFTVPRPDGSKNFSPNIVAWVNSKLGVNLPAPEILGDGDLEHNVVVKTVIRNLLDSKNCDFIYIAENKVHDDSYPGAPKRAPRGTYKRVLLPFWELTKDYTIDLYFKEDVTELLLLTHSCTEKTLGRCGHCYQCKERAWAFSQLNKDDPGII